jgi:hypothetical protein
MLGTVKALKPLEHPGTPRAELPSLRDVGRTILWIAGFFVVLFLAAGGYRAADDAGWVIHSRDIATYIDGNWMNAEYRTCSTVPELNVLYCSSTFNSDAESHVLPVSFHGRLDRTDHTIFHWRCQRSEKGLECWALD